MDGIGGLQTATHPGTELELAKTPNLDKLSQKSSCGLLIPAGHGITAGSGPGHFALFGHDPITSNIGRGVLEAAGICFKLTENDVVARGNFSTIDKKGLIVDRRAGRISDSENKRLCKLLNEKINLINKWHEKTMYISKQIECQRRIAKTLYKHKNYYLD